MKTALLCTNCIRKHIHDHVIPWFHAFLISRRNLDFIGRYIPKNTRTPGEPDCVLLSALPNGIVHVCACVSCFRTTKLQLCWNWSDNLILFGIFIVQKFAHYIAFGYNIGKKWNLLTHLSNAEFCIKLLQLFNMFDK